MMRAGGDRLPPLERIELADPRWSSFVADAPRAHPFHDPRWAAMLGECYHLDAFALAAVDASGTVVAGLPVLEVKHPLSHRRWVSLPFTDHCRPLAVEGTDRHELVKRIDDARRAHGVPVVEVRADLDAAGHEVARAILHTRSLAADVDSLVPTIKKKTLGSVRKAEREGVTVTRGTEAPDLIEVFYALHLSTRRRQGVPVQPRRFFRLYWDRIIASGLGFVSIARVGSLPIAATVFMASHDTIVYKYAASDRRYGNLGANHLTMWDAIRWGCESGYTTFDFGRTDIGNDGLRAFKSSWGADEEPLVYAAIGEAEPSGGRDHVSGVLKKVIQHSPSIVCRGLGEALYKYSA